MSAAGLAMGKAPRGNSSNMQLATITAVGATVTAQIDGSDSTFTLICDADRLDVNPATVGDRVLCTRQGSSMYEIALVSSAYTPPAITTPFVSYGLTANQSLSAATETTILFNLVLQTRVTFAAPTLGLFTVPTTGLYMITCRAGFALNAAVTRRYACLSINGASDFRNEQSSSTVGQWHLQINDIRQLTVGDTVALRMFQDSGAALNAVALDNSSTAPATTFKMAKIG